MSPNPQETAEENLNEKLHFWGSVYPRKIHNLSEATVFLKVW